MLAILLTGCGNTKTYTEQEQQAFQNLKDMVTAQNFEIESDFARPMATTAFMQVANTNILGPGNSASQIDINNNSNKLTVKGDTISGYFPYFGEQRFGGGYPGTNHQGIEFKDVPENYKMTFNDDKHIVNINFSIEDQYRTNENYNVFITLFPNKRSTIQINSTNRTSIEFSGEFKALDSQK
jgi:hypothetical protein